MNFISLAVCALIVVMSPIVRGQDIDYFALANEPWSDVPEEDRAWPLYLEAMREYKIYTSDALHTEWPTHREHPNWDAAVEWLDGYQGVIDELSIAGKTPHLGYWYRPSPVSPLLEHSEDLSLAFLIPGQVEKLLSYDTSIAIASGDSNLARRNIEAMLGAARLFGNESGLGEGLSHGGGIVQDAYQYLWEAMQNDDLKFSDAELRQLRNAFLKIDTFRWTEEWLRVGELEFLSRLDWMYTEDGQFSIGRWSSYNKGVFERRVANFERFGMSPEMFGWEAYDMEDVGNVMRAAGKQETIDMARRCHAMYRSKIMGDPWRTETWRENNVRNLTRAKGNKYRFHLVEGYYGYGEPIVHWMWRAKLHASSSIIMIDAELYRREHGVYPKSKSEFPQRTIDVWPIDPFDGQPIRYLLRDGAPVLYSIGTDRADDLGTNENGFVVTRFFNPDKWTERSDGWTEEALARFQGDWILIPADEAYP